MATSCVANISPYLRQCTYFLFFASVYIIHIYIVLSPSKECTAVDDIIRLFPASSEQCCSSRVVDELEEYFQLHKELETAEALRNYAQTADKGGRIITGSIF